MQNNRIRFRSKNAAKKLQPLKIEDTSFNQKFQNNVQDIVLDFNQQQKKTEQDISETATIKKTREPRNLNQIDDFTSEQRIGSQISINTTQLRTPYQFIGVASPTLRFIILPHFSFKSITFVLSLVMFFIFIALFIVYKVSPQTDTSWGCLLFKAQNKFYPRQRQKYQLWRVGVSGLFHSNFIHLLLNLLGLQLYGYFVQWYLGHLKFAFLIVAAMVNSHFLSCLSDMYTVSTSSSGILYSILAVKIIFFIRYRNYQPLDSKRIALCGLLALIFGVNVIVLFVGGNVDIGGHVGGFVTGLFYSVAFYQFQQRTKKTKFLMFLMIGVLIALIVSLITVCFTINSKDIENVNKLIDDMC